jgi:prepilin-type N-terminal cleavage/methylation domain-containing protein
MTVPAQTRLSPSAGFSLIELLSTTVVIGVLAVLLIAGHSRFLSTSLEAQSMGNLRQLGAAAMLFAADNNNALLPFRMDIGDPPGMWYAKLLPYVNWETGRQGKYGAYPDIFYCPKTKIRYAINRICGWGDKTTGMREYVRRGQGVWPNSINSGSPILFDLPGGLSQTAWFTTGNGGGDFMSQTQRDEDDPDYIVYPHNDHAIVLMMDGSIRKIKNPHFAEDPDIRKEKEWIDFFGYYAY